jgi:hypothetical protein
MTTEEPSKTAGKGMSEKGKEIQTRKGKRKNGTKDRTKERTSNDNRIGIGKKCPRKKKKERELRK